MSKEISAKIKNYLSEENLKNYRPIPFWSWNDKLEIQELVSQIRWMKEQGFGGYFMHARSGLITILAYFIVYIANKIYVKRKSIKNIQ